MTSYGHGIIRGKVLQWDYDYLLARSDDECCYSLSEREVQIILAMLDYIGWTRRYIATTEVDQNVIDRWQGNLARKLMSGCCPDDEKLTHFTAEGEWEVSTDGGETWQSEPGSDPRNDGTALPPLPGSDDSTKCAAADNARDQFKAIRDTLISLLTAGTTVLAVIAGIMGAIGAILGLSGVGTAIGVLLVGLATALLATTPESVEEDLSDEIMDQFRCILYCHMQPNGQFTYNDWLAIITECDATFTGFANTFFHGIVAGMGYIGLSNAGTIGATTADDCGDCPCGEWCYTFDFTVGEHGWVLQTSPYEYGKYTSGVGFQQADDYDPADAIEISRTFSARTINNVTIEFDPSLTGTHPFVYMWLGHYTGTVLTHDGSITAPYTFVVNEATNELSFDFDPYTGGQQFWAGALVRITITGLGSNPFGMDNCE